MSEISDRFFAIAHAMPDAGMVELSTTLRGRMAAPPEGLSSAAGTPGQVLINQFVVYMRTSMLLADEQRTNQESFNRLADAMQSGRSPRRRRT